MTCRKAESSARSRYIGIWPTCDKAFPFFVATKVIEALAGEVVDGYSDGVARAMTHCKAQPLVSSSASWANWSVD
ncbi:hypothetical protein CDAR_32711 [Caerostris darwini]|uniref:Uncharacterized protein n=1 Tax=Caerostris darwini TaxID=1538125 RepID=A0AAV4PF82_9ARAC|nr:hypothetical protein CDAR_32711 [Caerostris darwini]